MSGKTRMSEESRRQSPQPKVIRAELTHEQEVSLVHDAPLSERSAQELKDRIALLQKRAKSGK